MSNEQANQEVLDWIKTKYRQGYDHQRLHDALLQQGYEVDEIDKAIDIALKDEKREETEEKKGEEEKVKKPKKEPEKKGLRPLPLIIIGTIIISLLGVGVIFFVSEINKIEPGYKINFNHIYGENLEKPKEIKEEEQGQDKNEEKEEDLEIKLIDCKDFPDKLESCEAFSCHFEHPSTEKLMKREIVGLIDDKCQYTEEMPNNKIMSCQYSEDLRKSVAQYRRDLEKAQSFEVSLDSDTEEGELKKVYLVDGEEVWNPVQEALDKEKCLIKNK